MSERDVHPRHEPGALGCLGLALGGGAGWLAGALLGVATFAPMHPALWAGNPRVGSAALVGGVAGGFLGATGGLALSPRLAFVPALRAEHWLAVLGLSTLAALGTLLSPLPLGSRCAPAGAFLVTAALTIAAFVRASRGGEDDGAQASGS